MSPGTRKVAFAVVAAVPCLAPGRWVSTTAARGLARCVLPNGDHGRRAPIRGHGRSGRAPHDRDRARGAIFVRRAGRRAITREVAGEARKDKRRRRLIEQLSDHFIICGYGQVGAARRTSSSRLASRSSSWTARRDDIAKERGVPYRKGSGSTTATSSVGTERARGLPPPRTRRREFTSPSPRAHSGRT